MQTTTPGSSSPVAPFPRRLALCRMLHHPRPYSDREAAQLAHRIEDACNDLLDCLAASLGEDYTLVSLQVVPQKGQGSQHAQLITVVGTRNQPGNITYPLQSKSAVSQN